MSYRPVLWQIVSEVDVHHAGVGSSRSAGRNKPRRTRHVGVLGDELEVAVARISPHGLDYAERWLVKESVGGVG